MTTSNISTSYVAVIRPEFQLCQITNPQGYLVKQTNIFLPVGTIYARLYFGKGCSPIGQAVKGKAVYDSRNNQLARGNEQFELHIVCSDVAEYRKLYITCGKSNILFNRRRTDNLMRDINNNGIGTRGSVIINFPIPGTRNISIPQDAPYSSWMYYQKQAVETELVASPDHIQSTPTPAVVDELAFVKSYTRTQLCAICKNFGIVHTGMKANQLKNYVHDQLVTRGISPIAVRQIFK